ncbi:hypothetical protein FKP32DRAFT_1682332 [Trametes sanguinea]|nr:hypothetical protein FKP32DRAFT_1682332 [Trametes sanguinea]
MDREASNDEHLHDIEGDEDGSDEESQAVTEHWQRLFALNAPESDRTKVPFPAEGFAPQVIAYGWAFPRSYFEKYAKRHNILIPLGSEDAARFGGESIPYGKLTEQIAEDDLALHAYILAVLPPAVQWHLHTLSGIKLECRTPFMEGCPDMFCIYDNYNFNQKREEIELATGLDIDDIVEILNDAIRAADPTIEALWVYDWDKMVVGFDTLV